MSFVSISFHDVCGKMEFEIREMLQHQVSELHCVTSAVTWMIRTRQRDGEWDTCHGASSQEMPAAYASCWPTHGGEEKKRNIIYGQHPRCRGRLRVKFRGCVFKNLSLPDTKWQLQHILLRLGILVKYLLYATVTVQIWNYVNTKSARRELQWETCTLSIAFVGVHFWWKIHIVKKKHEYCTRYNCVKYIYHIIHIYYKLNQ